MFLLFSIKTNLPKLSAAKNQHLANGLSEDNNKLPSRPTD